MPDSMTELLLFGLLILCALLLLAGLVLFIGGGVLFP